MKLLPQHAESLQHFHNVKGYTIGVDLAQGESKAVYRMTPWGGARQMGRTLHRSTFGLVVLHTVFPEKVQELMQMKIEDMTPEQIMLRCKLDIPFFVKHYCKVTL